MIMTKYSNYRRKSVLLSAIFALTIFPTSIWAGDPVAGEAKASLCLTCHGKGDTVVGAGTPIISGQYEDYLIQTMKNYRSGARNNAAMTGFVANLTDKDIADLAAFYASLESSLFTPDE